MIESKRTGAKRTGLKRITGLKSCLIEKDTGSKRTSVSSASQKNQEQFQEQNQEEEQDMP